MINKKLSIEVISDREKRDYGQRYIVIRELYKLEQPLKIGSKNAYFIGIREVWEKNLFF